MASMDTLGLIMLTVINADPLLLYIETRHKNGNENL